MISHEKKLRRKDRALTEEEAMILLNKAEYGVLSTVTENGKPYGVPLNFCIIERCIYFHCAVEGQNIDNIKQNKSVSFCTVGNTKILPDKFGTKYESVIVAGEVEEVFDMNKQIALEGLLHKYSPDFFDKGIKYIEGLREKTRVFKITINNLTGKARKQ
jgi:nitroimidazol reductase NimA-like FMN-containing flavoprotein (pyridoxamine 5'-phosphate oxidase superfamily)